MDNTADLKKEPELEDRREALRRLGKYAVYAAPFTLIASKATAQQSGSGSGGRSHSATPAARH